MQYKPLSGKARLYLLDEVHQTTRDFQHAVLKALEDTPEWIYFVLCTTAPEKLLPTIKNRCSKFEVSTLSDRNMDKLLDWILTEEKVTIPDDIEKSIIRAADGCPRQALVMLDQIIDLKEEDMMEAIREIEIKEQAVIDLCRALLRGEPWKGMKEILKGIDEEPEKVRRAVLGYITSVVLNDERGGFLHIYDAFRDPFFNTGRAGLVFACYEVVKQ
jgi:DNA polymerase-3 subunit gamma/tau